jgi:ribosome-associated protein
MIAKAPTNPSSHAPAVTVARNERGAKPTVTTLTNDPEHPSTAEAAPSAPSKTRRKHEMQALQDLGAELCALDSGRLASLDLPERLVDAIVLARSITRHEAKRRQMQYIGRLMRDVDAGPLRDALAAWAQGPQRDREAFARVERWRDRVLAEPDGMQAFVATYPATDADVLARLVTDARAERARGAPPRRSRALFRELKRLVDEG